MADDDFWTVDRVERFNQLWQDGVSLTETAKELGTTRGAVAGKRRRLRRAQMRNVKSFRLSTSETRTPANPPPMTRATLAVDGIGIFNLRATNCRAVIGRGPDKMARFCGKPIHDKSFCKGHYSEYYHSHARM